MELSTFRRGLRNPALRRRRNGVATITLNQPDTRNALSNEVLGELIAAFEAARDDEAVRCVVLTSSHERVFSSGGDLGGFAADVPLVHKHFGSDRFVKLFRLIGELASRRSAPRTGTCSRARSGSRSRAT